MSYSLGWQGDHELMSTQFVSNRITLSAVGVWADNPQIPQIDEGDANPTAAVL